MNTTNMLNLSQKPSAAVRQAVEDLVEVENLPNVYNVDMGIWHTHDADESGTSPFCSVCLAGATMARRGELSPHESAIPDDFPADRDILEMLDALLWGVQEEAAEGTADDSLFYALTNRDELLGRTPEKSYLSVACRLPRPPRYEHNPEQFKSIMLEIADILEKEGY